MFLQTRERILLEGIMPERALLRLKRAEIDLFDVKKPQKTQIVFSVKKKDSEKVFAIYPKVCYNRNGYSPYTAQSLGVYGVGKYVQFIKKRIGFALGALLFCACTLFADGFVFGVDFVGTAVYAREAYAALESYGIKPFARYVGGNEDLIAAQLLTLRGVEFCSVRKSGLRVQVEMRLGNMPAPAPVDGDMTSKHTGVLTALTVLKGTALKKIGDNVAVGERLVGGWFAPEGGGQVCVEPIARASIACTYECVSDAADAQTAFAVAYMGAGITDGDLVTERTVLQTDAGFYVRIGYTAIESINF